MTAAALVAALRCRSYGRRRVQSAVKEALDRLGGMAAFVRPGERVLVKPNLLQSRPPDDAVTTHPALVAAVCHLVRRAGGVPFVGDSPGGMPSDLEGLWRRTGMTGAAARCGARLVNFSAAGVRRIELGEPEMPWTFVSGAASAFDRVIFVPKLKTHTVTLMTGAIKNCFGFVPGAHKTEFHRRAPGPAALARLLAALFAHLRPDLVVLDAVVGMEGPGPGAGRPRPLGFILAGADAVAVDAVAAAALGYDPAEVGLIQECARRGLGQADPRRIELLGLGPEDLRVPGFRRVGPSPLEPLFAAAGIAVVDGRGPQVRPADCAGCGRCAEACPAGAIEIRDGRAVIDRPRCLRCMCCHELCPRTAVEIAPWR